jgi:hypothetical protein
MILNVTLVTPVTSYITKLMNGNVWSHVQMDTMLTTKLNTVKLVTEIVKLVMVQTPVIVLLVQKVLSYSRNVVTLLAQPELIHILNP